MRAPRLCRCGNRVAWGARCPCEARQDAERKARFDKTRPSSSARGYNRDWERARAAFLREHRHCRRCGRIAKVVDHIVPHKGDDSLFWDRGNWQPLCVPCHSGAKQREERRANLRNNNEKATKAMSAFAADGARFYIGRPVANPAHPDLESHDWIEVSGVETIGATRTGGLEVVARTEKADTGQSVVRIAAVGRACRAFRVTFRDGSERRFAARITAAKDRRTDGRFRIVLAVESELVRLPAKERAA
jgi:5-methylcytosine-specific restriction endonuclease McrA